MTPGLLLVAALGLPFLLLGMGLGPSARPLLPRLLWLAPAPALGLAALGPWVLPVGVGGWIFHLDTAGALLLAASSALWMIAGAAVPAFDATRRPSSRFCACWLLTLAGNIGVFLAVDLVGFLVFYALVSLPACGLIAAGGTPEARRAATVTLAFALLGENVLLIAFVLLAGGVSPAAPAVSGLLLLGFGMKIALLPLHVWMPLAYSAAPLPAAAVLSGAAVKAGVIGLLRFLPSTVPLPTWGEALTLLGFCGAFVGVIIGVTQRHPKPLLAYSSISQMGFLAAVLGMGVATGDAGVTPLVAFYAAHHVLAKGALFLAIGAGSSRWLVMAPAALVGLGLAGLPLTGGAVAKLAVKDPLGSGLVETLATLSSAGTALLMTFFLFRLAEHAGRSDPADRGTRGPWLACAAGCLVFPWITLGAAGLERSHILAPETLWKTAWPVALGVLAAWSMRRIRWPEIPAGDLASLATPLPSRWATAITGVARGEAALRHWPVACCALVLIVLALVAASQAGPP